MLEIIGLAFLITLCVFSFVGIMYGIIHLIITKIKNEHIASIVFSVFLFLLIFIIMIFSVWSSVVV